MEQDDQKEFMAYLVKMLKATDQKDFEDKVKELGENKISELYKQFQESKTISAKLGAKLGYINQLNGKCPKGYDAFKKGGCIRCKKKVAAKKAANLKASLNAPKRFGKHDDSRGGFLDLAAR